MLEVLLMAVWIGLSSAALTCIIRYAPLVDKWVLEGRRPWVCDVCMTLWTSALFAGGMYYVGFRPTALAAWAPGYAIGKWMLMRLTDPQGPAPMIPVDSMPLPLEEPLEVRPTTEIPVSAREADDTNTPFDPRKHGAPPTRTEMEGSKK